MRSRNTILPCLEPRLGSLRCSHDFIVLLLRHAETRQQMRLHRTVPCLLSVWLFYIRAFSGFFSSRGRHLLPLTSLGLPVWLRVLPHLHLVSCRLCLFLRPPSYSTRCRRNIHDRKSTVLGLHRRGAHDCRGTPRVVYLSLSSALLTASMVT